MMLDTNYLSNTGIKIGFDHGEILWYDCTLSMHPRTGLTSTNFDHMEDMCHIQFEDKLLSQDWLELDATKILDARYKWSDVQEVIDGQMHLKACQKCDLLDVLKWHQKLFDGTLGVYPHKIGSHRHRTRCQTSARTTLSRASHSAFHVQM